MWRQLFLLLDSRLAVYFVDLHACQTFQIILSKTIRSFIVMSTSPRAFGQVEDTFVRIGSGSVISSVDGSR